MSESSSSRNGPDLAELPPLKQIAVAYRLLALAVGSTAIDPAELEPELLGAAQFALQILGDELRPHDLT
ncbi:MAG: hypothetical protein QOI31_1768 [Solirubrobacterales bacterium]|jgi:hypothetical protein|nr:hypothetical protein [Solirubrobacterales bacterium]